MEFNQCSQWKSIIANLLNTNHSNHWKPIENQAIESFETYYSNHWKLLEYQSFESLQNCWKSINLVIEIQLTINQYNDWISIGNQSLQEQCLLPMRCRYVVVLFLHTQRAPTTQQQKWKTLDTLQKPQERVRLYGLLYIYINKYISHPRRTLHGSPQAATVVLPSAAKRDGFYLLSSVGVFLFWIATHAGVHAHTCHDQFGEVCLCE